jgi:hypothetical protein
MKTRSADALTQLPSPQKPAPTEERPTETEISRRELIDASANIAETYVESLESAHREFKSLEAMLAGSGGPPVSSKETREELSSARSSLGIAYGAEAFLEAYRDGVIRPEDVTDLSMRLQIMKDALIGDRLLMRMFPHGRAKALADEALKLRLEKGLPDTGAMLAMVERALDGGKGAAKSLGARDVAALKNAVLAKLNALRSNRPSMPSAERFGEMTTAEFAELVQTVAKFRARALKDFEELFSSLPTGELGQATISFRRAEYAYAQACMTGLRVGVFSKEMLSKIALIEREANEAAAHLHAVRDRVESQI